MKQFSAQRGVALLIGLMFLLLLTVIGLSASNVSIMQERMAGNVSQANIALQQAESTLRAVEQRLVNHIQGGAGGLGYVPPSWKEVGLEQNDCTLSHYNLAGSDQWKDDGATGGKYIVVDLRGFVDASGMPYGSACRPMSESGGAAVSDYYLVAARSTGPDGSADSIVQSIFYWSL